MTEARVSRSKGDSNTATKARNSATKCLQDFFDGQNLAGFWKNTRWRNGILYFTISTYEHINWLAVSHLPLVFCISGICKSGPTLTESPDPKYRWPDWNWDQGSACAAGNVWKRISLRCGLGNDGYFKWLPNETLHLWCFQVVKLFAWEKYNWFEPILVAVGTWVNLRKPLPDVFWDDDEWISQCMRKDNQARSYVEGKRLHVCVSKSLHLQEQKKTRERALLYHYPWCRLTSLPSTTFSSPISGSSF